MQNTNKIYVIPLYIILAACLALASGCGPKTFEPPNVGLAKQEVKKYYESGQYEIDCKKITDAAFKELISWKGKKKTAILLDIDDTALNTYEQIMEFDFGYVPEHWNRWAAKANAPANPFVLAIAQQAIKQGSALFFITGRREKLRSYTEQNLLNAGYANWEAVIMKPNDYHGKAADYKLAERKKIHDMGYKIIIGIGDQESDLKGRYIKHKYKLPNPCYYIP